MSNNTPTTSSVEPLKVILDIVQTEMGLTSKQIAAAYQDYRIPSDGLFVVGGYMGPSEQVANQSYLDDATNQEVSESVFRHTIQLELMSMAPDNSARIRKEEMLMALRSSYSLRQQDKNFIGIAWLQGDITDATHQEGTTMLNRYVTTCSVNALHRKIKAADYLNVFPVELTTESQDGRATTVDINPTVNPIGG